MIKLKSILFFILFFTGFFFGHTQGFFQKFKDSTDNALDLSYFLKDLNGVLPIISPITEPAVGYGAAVAGLYFIAKEADSEIGYQKPDIAGIAAGYTANGTWFAGGGYAGFWKKDKVRYRGVLGYGDINLNFYSNLTNKPREFNMKSFFLLQQSTVRLKDSNFFLGGKYVLSKIDTRFKRESGLPDIDPRDIELWNSGLSIITEYEDFNNVFSPTKGKRIHLSYDQNLELIGSTKNWGKLNFFSQFYFPVNTTWVPAFRINAHLATGDTPFYARPYVDLRGVPALRYQGDLTVLVETEQLINIGKRWGLVGFTGVGTAFNNLEDMKAGDLVWNAGGGFRYLIARLFGLKMGMDIARGPEDWAVYVVFGTSWLK